MIEKINKKYGLFSDSWISDIKNINSNLELTITCANHLNKYSYEVITLRFLNVISFCNNKNDKEIIVIKDALLKIDNGNVVFDADPIDYFDYLEENKNSKFIIKSKSIEYSFREFYKAD